MATGTRRILVTGATGKVGQTFVRHIFGDPRFEGMVVRALVHNRTLDTHDRLEIQRGSIQDVDTVKAAMDGVTYVLHLATCKETPSQIMDVAVKGMFWLLEASRMSPTFRQFILLGGDGA